MYGLTRLVANVWHGSTRYFFCIKQRVDFWDDIKNSYKIDMSSLKPYALSSVVNNAHVKTLQAEQILARAEEVLSLDLLTVDKFRNDVSVMYEAVLLLLL